MYSTDDKRLRDIVLIFVEVLILMKICSQKALSICAVFHSMVA